MKIKLSNIATVLLLTMVGALPVLAATPSGAPAPLDKTLSAATAPGTKTAISPAQAASVLDRFRMYSGPRTPEALMALFAAPVTTAIHQQPEIALSDGATMVKITMEVGSPGNKSPNVALKDAQLISFKHINAEKWEIEAIPAVGTWASSLILLTDSESREIPLTAAPRLPAGTDLSKKGFIAFLGGTKTAGRPLLDLNDDGRRDYLDDYIFTANYLVGRDSAATVPEANQVAESQPPTNDQQFNAEGHDTVQTSAGEILTPDQGLYVQTPTAGQGPASSVSTAVQIPSQSGSTTGSIPSSNVSNADAPALIKLAPGVEPNTNVHNVNNRNQRARGLQKSTVPGPNVPPAAVPPTQ
jgi:hypothetical protein